MICLQAIFRQMVNIHCDPNDHCPNQYYCDQKNNCIHNPVFPLTPYPILIYCLFPFASALCNVSGNSFGEFKVLFLMDLLDYTQSAATVVSYPLTVGTALFNFITLLPRRHPNKDTSIVDYNIVMIIIPSVLFGSTIGGIVNKFIPPIIADVIIMVILGLFSVKFFLRFHNFRKQDQQQRMKELQQLSKELQITQIGSKNRQLAESLFDKTQQQRVKQKIQNIKSDGQVVKQNTYKKQLQQQLKYESTYHLPHILATCIIFGIFQILSFLAQGKIIPFSLCSTQYPIGISCLAIVFLSFVVVMYRYTKNKMEYYRKIQFNYQYKLDQFKMFIPIVAASFLGGFNSGAFGVGSSTSMIFCFLYLKIEPIVVSATVGYQVVFGGLGSLSQAFATDEISAAVAGFFFAITFFIGGAFSWIALRLVKKMNQNKTNQVLMLIVGCLTGGSTIALIVNIIMSYKNFGSTYMISSPTEC